MDTSQVSTISQEGPPAVGACANHMKVYLRVRPITQVELASCQPCRDIGRRCFSVDHGLNSLLARSSDSEVPVGMATAPSSERVANQFAFTRVFDESVKQEQLYAGTVAGIVEQLLSGALASGLVFNYGVTGSGKTYTVQGTPECPGVLPRALDALFAGLGGGRLVKWLPFRPASFNEAETMSQSELDAVVKETEALLRSDPGGEATAAAWRRAAATSSVLDIEMPPADDQRQQPLLDKRYSVWISYAEIYNEVVYDLLEPITSSSGLASGTPCGSRQQQRRQLGGSRTQLELRTDRTGAVYIRGLRCLPVSSSEEAYRLMLLGRLNQQVAATKLNQQSSRSHSLFAIRLVHCVNKPQPQFCQVSSLTFCDLAGSERQPRSAGSGSLGPAAAAAAGERTREAGSINTSLLTLRRCVEILQQNQRCPKASRLVPFRDSKLTRLIQPYFSGSGRAVMIVNISQCPALFEETLSALRFSALAKSVIVSEPTPKRIRLAVLADKAASAASGSRASSSYGMVSPAGRRRRRFPLAAAAAATVAAAKKTQGASLAANNGDCAEKEEDEEDVLDVTYADGEEAEMADIAQCEKEELIAIIESMRRARARIEDEVEQREMRIRRELIGERDRLMADMEERFEQQLQQQRDSMLDSHEERLREYIGTSERLAERRLERWKQRMEANVAALEEKLGEARTRAEQQELTIANLTEQRDELQLRLNSVCAELAEICQPAGKQALLENGSDDSACSAGAPMADGARAALGESLRRVLSDKANS